MARPHGSVRIGPISLFALIIILCLAVLAVLSVTTARAELSITERQAATTTETYQLEIEGQSFVAHLDAALASGDEAALGSAIAEAGAVRDGDLVSAIFTTDSGRTLSVVLRINDDKTYTIEQWKTTTQWNDDDAGENLWLG